MSTFGDNKCQRQSTSHLSPRAGCKNAKNSPFAPSSPPSSSSSQSSSPPRRRDAIRSVLVNAIRKTTGNNSTTVKPFRGVRFREELNKYVSEIRPTRCAKKIWLGTYDTAEEAARAFDIGNLYCKKNLPLNFEDSPVMLQRMERISSQLSPEKVRNAIAKHAKECARLHMSGANLPENSSCAGEVIATPEPTFNYQAAMAQSGQFCNQFDARSVFVSFEQMQPQYDHIQQAYPPQQQLHFDSKLNHNHAAGTRSEIFLEQLPEQVCAVTEVATAVPLTMRGDDGSRSWEFDVYSKIPSDASLPDPDIAGIPALSDAPLDAIDNHMFEDHMFQAFGSGDLMFDNLFYKHTGV